MDVIYGIQVTGMDDPYIIIAEKVDRYFTSAILPGAFLVDTMPFRTYTCLIFCLIFMLSMPSETYS